MYYQSIKDLLRTKICSQNPPTYNFEHEYDLLLSTSHSVYEVEFDLWAKYCAPDGSHPRTTFPGKFLDVNQTDHYDAALALLLLSGSNAGQDPKCISKSPPGYPLKKQPAGLDAQQGLLKYAIMKKQEKSLESQDVLVAAGNLVAMGQTTDTVIPTEPLVEKPAKRVRFSDVTAINESNGKSNALQGLVSGVLPRSGREYSESMRWHGTQSGPTESLGRPEGIQQLLKNHPAHKNSSIMGTEVSPRSPSRTTQANLPKAIQKYGSSDEISTTDLPTQQLSKTTNLKRPHTSTVNNTPISRKRGRKSGIVRFQLSHDNVPNNTFEAEDELPPAIRCHTRQNVSNSKEAAESEVRRNPSKDSSESSLSTLSSSTPSPPRSRGTTKEPVGEGKTSDSDGENADGSFLSSNANVAGSSPSVSCKVTPSGPSITPVAASLTTLFSPVSSRRKSYSKETKDPTYPLIPITSPNSCINHSVQKPPSKAVSEDDEGDYELDDEINTDVDEPSEPPSSDKDDEDYTDSEPPPKKKKKSPGIIIDDSESDEDTLPKSTHRKSQAGKKSVPKQRPMLDKPRKQHRRSKPLAIDNCNPSEPALPAKPIKPETFDFLLYYKKDEPSEPKIRSKPTIPPENPSKNRFQEQNPKPPRISPNSNDNNIQNIPTSSPPKRPNKGKDKEKAPSTPLIPSKPNPTSQNFNPNIPSQSQNSHRKKSNGTITCPKCHTGIFEGRGGWFVVLSVRLLGRRRRLRGF
ncbi:hypothetical protein HYFRA_00005723 [Hymenoscyphus fraxineus]|uniref:Uncharacterized protein n=1 Tax=Hymenoscyphus fraxineus TaxID=746836 RepID=A0A9N9KRZ7_9HELO|nr:hypothetical protein HYFRA_00005723 [Hymenoscyphus fraxineus]